MGTLVARFIDVTALDASGSAALLVNDLPYNAVNE